MGTLRGEGRTDNRMVAANPRGTLAVEGLDGTTTFTRDAAGSVTKISMLDEWGKRWYKTVDRDTSGQISSVTGWIHSTTSSTTTTISTVTTVTTVSTATTATTITSTTTVSTATTASTTSVTTGSTGSTVSTSS